jgi:hypothetical protein
MQMNFANPKRSRPRGLYQKVVWIAGKEIIRKITEVSRFITGSENLSAQLIVSNQLREHDWITPVKLATEWYQEQEGYKRIMIATEAKKIRYDK